MSDAVVQPGIAAGPAPIAAPGELVPYALFAGVLLTLLIYFAGADQGATSVLSGNAVHEFVHDARHLLGFPCH